MAFLLKADYYTQIRQLRLEQMTESIEAVFLQVSGEAVAVVRNYLYTLYNTELIFAATGDNRDPLVLLHCKHVAIYILHQRLPMSMIPDNVKDNYRNTLDFLDQVARGKIGIDLPRRQSDTDGDGVLDTDNHVFLWGGQKQRTR